MSADAVAVALVVMMAPAATLYPILIATTTPWWRSLVGRALMVSSLGLALLIDLAIAHQFLGSDYAASDAVRLGVFSLVLVGVWMMLLAFLREKLRDRRDS